MSYTKGTDFGKRAIIEAQIAHINETKKIFSPALMKAKMDSDLVKIPYITIDGNDAYNADKANASCMIALGNASSTNETKTISRVVSRGISYCKADFRNEDFNADKQLDQQLEWMFTRQLNKNDLADIVGQATAFGPTEFVDAPDFTTDAGVVKFVSQVRDMNSHNVFFKPTIDNGSITAAQLQNKTIIFVGTEAKLKLDTIFGLNSLKNCCGGIKGVMELIGQDIYVVPLSDLATDPNQVIVMLGGAAVFAYRGDKMEYGMKDINSIGQAGITSVDITPTTDVLRTDTVRYMRTEGETLVFDKFKKFILNGVTA